MKRNLDNFTRGSQLLGHFGFMFAAGLKGPLIVALIVVVGTSWWMLSGGLSDHESYLVWMRIYASIYGFMEFDAHKQVAIETAYGGTVTLPMAFVERFPPVARAWSHMVAIMEDALLRSALLLAPAFVLFYWVAARFGRRFKERKHERGALLATLPELAEEIRVHNAAERAGELSTALGWGWRLCSRRELERAFPYCPSHLARVTYPWRLEQSHAMLIGTTGMGKTVALSEMIEEARGRGQRAVIFDLTGTFIEHFYDAGRDTILNPLDARCPQWSVFDECRDDAEFTAAAAALVPHDGGGSEQFWVLAARLLFVEMCLKLRARGATSNEALARELMTADLAAVHRLMRGTVADPLTAPEAARMAESIRAVFNANARALKLLPRRGRRFSLRQWIEEDEADGAAVFISARYIDMSVCSQLLTVWLDLAMNTLMTLEPRREVRMWFFLDELGALHRLPALEKGLQTARNYGGAIVAGIHAYAKLRDVYGENMAKTLSSLARTKLILGTADRDTATWCSDFIGHAQVHDKEVGYTYGYNNARDAVSLTSRRHIEPLLLPDQLMNLPRLSGFLKFPDGFPAAPVKLRPVDRPRRAAPFIRRAEDGDRRDDGEGPSSAPHATPAGGASGTDERPSPNDDGAGQRIAARQGELALSSERSAPAGESEAFSNDALNEAVRGAAASDPDRGNERVDLTGRGVADARRATRGELQAKPALPKDAVLRGGGSEGHEPEAGAAVRGERAPTGSPHGVRSQDEPTEPGGAGEARKLMLEDGLPEPDAGTRDVRGLGEADMEI